MILEATHRTRYTYPSPVRGSHNELRLKAMTDESQTCFLFDLKVRPFTQVFSYESIGGTVHYFAQHENHNSLEIVATSRVETLRSDPTSQLDFINSDWGFYQSDSCKQGFAEFLVESPYVESLVEGHEIASQVNQDGLAQFLLELNHRVNRSLTYQADATHVHTTVREALAGGAGVCQDYAHIMLACLRAMQIPARYVSGYLYGGEGYRGEAATHAWVDCLLPSGNWLALDPTNNLLANDHHVRIHTGRDYGDVAPTKGVYMGPPALSLDVSVTVAQVSPTFA